MRIYLDKVQEILKVIFNKRLENTGLSMILGTTLYNMCAVHWRLCSASGGIQSIGGTSSVQMEVHHQCIGKYHDLLEGHPGGEERGFQYMGAIISLLGAYHQCIGGRGVQKQ